MTKPNPKAMLHLVRQFRDGILDGEDPEQWCFMVSAPLEGFLSAMGIKCKLVKGQVHTYSHFWIELEDKTIIDATASQFRRPNGREMPIVFIGNKPDWYQVKNNKRMLKKAINTSTVILLTTLGLGQHTRKEQDRLQNSRNRKLPIHRSSERQPKL